MALEIISMSRIKPYKPDTLKKKKKKNTLGLKLKIERP